MTVQLSLVFSPFILAGLFSVGIGGIVAAVAWRQREFRGARTYAVLMVLLSVWSLLYVGQLLESTVATKRPWLVARHAISPVVGLLFWRFTAQYIDRPEFLSARYMGPILAGGIVVGLLPVVNPAGLYWTDMSLYTAGSIPRLAIGFGPAFGLFCLYTFLVVGGGHGYFVLTLLDSFSIYRRQLALMAVVGTIEFALLIAFLTDHVAFLPDLNPWPHIQLVTYNMVFVAAPLGWSYFKQSLFDLQVLDREAVIENMDDAVFVFDTDDVLRSVNDAGLELIDRTDTPDGESVTDIFSATPTLRELYQDRTRNGPGDAADTTESVELVVDGDTRWFDIRVSPISNAYGDQIGTVLVTRDVTARHRSREQLQERTRQLAQAKARLERKNEQLERLAGIVSHDLQTPLSTADKLTTLLRADLDDPAPEIEQSLADLEATHQRLREFADHLPRLARESTDVDQPVECGLAEIAEAAWNVVDTDPLALQVESDCQLSADPRRLQQLFENLFQNAVTHAIPDDDSRPSATVVRVGSFAEGFYVEDDGPGIRPEQRDELFEYGMTTGSGSGFGLAIVRTIVEAHGWEIDVADGPTGGARFEITTD